MGRKKKNTDTPPEPWERQSGESAEAFGAFVMYRDMGADGQKRSLAKLGQNLGKTKAQMEHWSSKWNWQERVIAWDDEVDRQTRKEIVKGITAMRKEYIEIANAMKLKALNAMSKMNVDEMTPKDIKEFLKTAMEMERISRIPEKDETVESRDDGFIKALNESAAADWSDDHDI